jgi:hypothetical protein
MPVGELIAAVKNAIKAASVSVTDAGRDLAVTSFSLKLNTVATATTGGGIDFRVPFIGMKVTLGASVERQNTQVIELTLVPEAGPAIETRDLPVELILVDAIETIRGIMATAVGGDDPFVLQDSAVELSFGVAADGSICFGINGELKDETTHILRLTIGRSAPAA